MNETETCSQVPVELPSRDLRSMSGTSCSDGRKQKSKTVVVMAVPTKGIQLAFLRVVTGDVTVSA